MRLDLRVSIFLSALALHGCAAGPRPDDPTRLEAELARDPTDLQATLFLAASQLRDGRVEQAGATLAVAPAERKSVPAYELMSAFAEEQLGRLQAARPLYESYLAAPGEPFRSEAAARLERLRWALERAETRALVTSTNPPAADRGLAVVLPVWPDLGDPDGRSIAMALRETVIADLGRTDLARAMPRRATDIAIETLGPNATGEEIAKALGARTVVLVTLETVDADTVQNIQGDTVRGQSIQLDATVTYVPTRGDPIVTESHLITERDDAPSLGKQLALEVYRAMEFELSDDDYEDVLRGGAIGIEPWISFAHGLAAWDAGEFAGAAREFARARAEDTGFDLVRPALRAAILAASAPDPRELAWSVAEVQLQRTLMLGLRGNAAAAYAQHTNGLGERQRPALTELLGPNVPGRTLLDLVIELDLP